MKSQRPIRRGHYPYDEIDYEFMIGELLHEDI